jgi:endo-1,4-beta-mannosidase
MKREELKSLIKEVIKEVSSDPQMIYLAGYKRGQDNYEDDNVQTDFNGYPEEFVKGYKKGVSKARWGKLGLGKFDKPNLTNILVNIGNVLSRGRYRP